MSAERPIYLDSSALVKLAVHEPESGALRQYLRRRRSRVSSTLARAEVARVLLPLGEAAEHRGRLVLTGVDLIRVSDRVLVRAGQLRPFELRTLDAIHLATAEMLSSSLARFVTYDDRLGSAAEALGWSVVAPA